MHKNCSRCGSDMELVLRNVVYRSRVKIQNVPVYCCANEECSFSQVVEVIKDDLKQLMNQLGRNPDRQNIEFEQVSEFSNIMVLVADHEDKSVVKQVKEERINDLLDLFLLAKSLGDAIWTNELRGRLTQIL